MTADNLRCHRTIMEIAIEIRDLIDVRLRDMPEDQKAAAEERLEAMIFNSEVSFDE